MARELEQVFLGSNVPASPGQGSYHVSQQTVESFDVVSMIAGNLRSQGEIEIASILKFPAPEPVEIASGEFTMTSLRMRVDTEAEAASDELWTITAPSTLLTPNETTIILEAASDDRTVIVKNHTEEMGNIHLANGDEYKLEGKEKKIWLIYDGDHGHWIELNRAGDTVTLISFPPLTQPFFDLGEAVIGPGADMLPARFDEETEVGYAINSGGDFFEATIPTSTTVPAYIRHPSGTNSGRFVYPTGAYGARPSFASIQQNATKVTFEFKAAFTNTSTDYYLSTGDNVRSGIGLSDGPDLDAVTSLAKCIVVAKGPTNRWLLVTGDGTSMNRQTAGGVQVDTAYHEFRIEWTESQVELFVDDVSTITSSSNLPDEPLGMMALAEHADHDMKLAYVKVSWQ